jgi:hypothetical protein
MFVLFSSVEIKDTKARAAVRMRRGRGCTVFATGGAVCYNRGRMREGLREIFHETTQ